MSLYKTIDGLLLRDMAMAGNALLESNRETVDALNVFPVPDGDTGTNMSLTMQSAIREINSKEFLRLDEAASALAKGALKGARGNSGVITSQLLRGFAKAVSGQEKVTPAQFAQAMKAGSDLAYKAVMKPKEGTILTVARVTAEEALKQAEKAPDDFEALFQTILTSGQDILEKTPDMLPVLKQANVVDSGGTGLMYIYTGYAAVIQGKTVEEILADLAAQAEADEEEDLDDLTHLYCTKFSIVNLSEDCEESDIDSLRRRLNRIGSHVRVKGDLQRVDIHVDTNHPGTAIEDGLEIGEIIDVSIENKQELKRKRDGAEQTPAKVAHAEPEKEHGMVAVSLGEGFSKIFHDLTVDVVVEGGQTMNPSIDDILSAIYACKAKTVYVFPNNGNVILAAQQAADLAENVQVYVIPTKNVAMGIAAAVAFQPDVVGELNARHMEEAAEHVKTGTVTYAIRDSEYNDIHIHQGDIIGLHNGKIEYSGANVHDVAMKMMEAVVDQDAELITVYYGADTTQADAEQLAEDLGAVYPDCDVECHSGGQPLYYYLISVE